MKMKYLSLFLQFILSFFRSGKVLISKLDRNEADNSYKCDFINETNYFTSFELKIKLID
jgi:hypothetical protein